MVKYVGTYPLIKRLLQENARFYIKEYLCAFACMALVAGMTALSAWIIKDIVNQTFIEKRFDRVIGICVFIFMIYLIKGSADYGQSYILSRIGNNMIARHQKRLFRHLLAQGIPFFDQWRMGDILTRFSHNAHAMRLVLELLITGIGRDVLTIIGLVTVMLLMDPFLAIIMCVIGPIAVFSLSRILKKIKKIAKSGFISHTQVTAVLQETLLGIKSIKALCCEDYMWREMQNAITDVEKKNTHIAALQAWTSPLMETLGGFMAAGIILYGGWQVITRGQDPGAFFAFLTALFMAYEPAKRLVKMRVKLQAALVGVRLMYDLLDAEHTETPGTSLQKFIPEKGHVRFRDVTFHYPQKSNTITLNALSFEARPGTITALVGPSGSGKTTIFALLERFYTGFQGRILIDGQDISQCTPATVRASIALVSQDTFLFSDTVYENLVKGCPQASRAQVIESARMAHAHAFIEALPQGYDTPIGENGTFLSGGQRQRLSIARAFLQDARLLLLDEATSSLDSESESHIQSALRSLMKGRTTIVIAHRLSTVRHAAKICVLQNGQIVEEGTHAQLLQKKGLYSTLYQIQFQE